MKLWPAIAFQAAEHIAGQAFAVQADQRRGPVGLADQQRDMVVGALGRAKCDDLRILGANDRQPRPGCQRQPCRIFIGVDIRDLYPVVSKAAADEKRGQQPRDAREAQRSASGGRIGHRKRAERPFQGRCEIELRIGQRGRGGKVDPRRTIDQDGRIGCRCVDLVDELQRRRPASADQHRRLLVTIERGEPARVCGLDRQQPRAADRHVPSPSQGIDGARDGAGVVHQSNSVTMGTWSDGFSQLRQSSCT